MLDGRPPASEPVSVMQFEDYKESYVAEVEQSIQFAGVGHDFFIRVKADELVASCRRQLGAIEGLRILDVGCGVGLMSRYLVPHFKDVVGIDITAGMIERAREQSAGATFVVYDGERIPFDDGSFDVVFIVCVMHHVPPRQWRSLTREMARVLRPGGVLFVFEHNPYNPLTRRAVNHCPFDKDAVLLTRQKASSLLRGAGLEPAEERYILFFPLEGSAFRSIESRLRWLPLGAQYFVSGRRAREV